MYSIPNSSSSKYRSSSRTQYTQLNIPNSRESLKRDLSKYDELIKKARDTINKFNSNMTSRSKSRLRGNTSTSHVSSQSRNYRDNKNYSFLHKRLITSSRESKDDILSKTQDVKGDIEEYYKSLFNQMRNDSNIQNEKIFKLESKNKQNELDLIDNEREKNRLRDRVKTLENRLNENNILYEDLKKQKDNLESNYDQLKFDYQNDMKKLELNSINKNRQLEDTLNKENEMLKNEINKYIKENINLKLKVKNLKNKIYENSNENSKFMLTGQSKLKETRSDYLNKSEKYFNDEEDLKNQLSNMQKLYDEQIERYNNLKDDYDELEIEMKSLKNENLSLKNDNLNFKNEIINLKNDNLRLKKKNEEKKNLNKMNLRLNDNKEKDYEIKNLELNKEILLIK